MKARLRRRKWIILGLFASPLLFIGALFAHAATLDVPQELRRNDAAGRRILDRNGRLLARQRTSDGAFYEPVTIEETPRQLVRALVAAEDQRFWHHIGIDPWAMARALLHTIRAGRVVSGASTITQQLVRQTFDRPRTFAGKWHEWALALAVERKLSKTEILEQYLNRVYFGPQILGVRAAADQYFGKSLPALDLSETATLVGLVRGPSLYAPTRSPSGARSQRDRVLARMLEEGFITNELARRSVQVPLTLLPRKPLPGAHHWVRLLSRDKTTGTITSTLDGPLQHELQTLVAERVRALRSHRAETSSAAAVVLDNTSGEVLAYVGSPDFNSKQSCGQNDGVRALRQPGSTLKPFLYAWAIDELGYQLSTQLPDRPKHFRTPSGFYSPRNYDRRFRDTVTLRRALANSLNVPAVYTLEKLGEARTLDKLRQLGLDSLGQNASHYGPALALGDGEVRLLALAQAYSTLARGGLKKEIRLRKRQSAESHPLTRLFSDEAAALITEVLADDESRRESFGSSNALDLEFPVAVKTGTSKGYRDSWTVGYTRTHTVAVWVGNFDGHPSNRMTGATAAGPLFRSIFRTVHQRYPNKKSDPKSARLHDVPLMRRPIGAHHWEWFSPRLGSRAFVNEETGPVGPASGSPPELDLAPPEVLYPRDGMQFEFDPAIPREAQTLVFKARDPGAASLLQLSLNGKPLPTQDGQAQWSLRPGNYTLVATSSLGQSGSVRFRVN